MTHIGLDFGSIQIAKTTVLGDRALVQIDRPFGFEVLMQKVGGRWLVAGL